MKGCPRVELCQASKVSEVQFELSLLPPSLEKTPFHNGNVSFPVSEVKFLTKSDVTVFLQSPKMWRFLVGFFDSPTPTPPNSNSLSNMQASIPTPSSRPFPSANTIQKHDNFPRRKWTVSLGSMSTRTHRGETGRLLCFEEQDHVPYMLSLSIFQSVRDILKIYILVAKSKEEPEEIWQDP